MQPAFGVALGICRTGFARLLGFHVFGCSTCWALPCRFNVPDADVGWIGQGAKQPIQLEQVISQPLASSPTSPLRHFVLVSLRARLLSTPTSLLVCFVSHSPVCSNIHPSASCLPGRVPSPAFHCIIYSIRARTRAYNTITARPSAPYLELRPHCAVSSPSIVTTKDGNGAIVNSNEDLGC